ncbi:MAG: DUF11 domain-containing protein [Nanoarchaeota archaeon]|nr:DUF11 domain-containing protein [Nanoarchaeota archaeon]
MRPRYALKLSLIAIILLNLTVICHAAELVSIYEGSAPYGINFTGEGYTFMISGNSNMENFIVNLPTGSTIPFKDAGCYTKDYFMVCYNGSREFEWVNLTLDKEYWNASINISKYVEVERKLVITKSYDYKEPVLIQDPISITIKLYNNASAPAKGIILKDSIPAALHVTEAAGCEDFGTNIRWFGTLNSGESHFCTYTVEATTDTEYDIAAEVEYIMEDITQTLTSTSKSINISIPLLEASSFLANNTLTVGEIIFYSINLTNVDEEVELMINKLKINIPDKIKILKSGPRLKEERYGLTLRDSLDKNESIDAWFLGGVIKSGNDTIITTIDYTVRGVFTQITLEDNISIDYNSNIEANVSFDNISINISGINITDNLSLDSNISEIDNLSGQSNISENITAPAPIITRATPEKEPIPYIVVIGIVIILLIIVGIIMVIKKRKREEFY